MSDIPDFVPETVLSSESAEKVSSPEPKKPKFVTKDVVMCVVVLVLIAVVAGVLLGVMNWLTYVDPDATIISQVAKYYGVDSSLVVKSEERLVNSGGKDEVLGCYVVKDAEGNDVAYVYRASGSGAKGGTVELLVHISAEGIIKDLEEYSQSETAGYFKKVMDANKAKYIGVDITKIQNFELNGKGENGVDAVSNATRTSNAVNNAVNAAVYAFNNYGAGVNQ